MYLWIGKVIYNITDLDFTVKLQENFFPAPEEFIENFKKNLEETNEATLRGHEQFMKMFESMDAKAIADHQAKINEREYWRRLRGEIFLVVFKENDDATFQQVVDYTRDYFNALYEQDKEFFSKNFAYS